jgi:hypothetical protein
MSRDQDAGRSHSINIDNSSFVRVREFKYLETVLTDQNSIQKEIKSRLGQGMYNGYRVFPGGRKRPGRDADPSTLLVPRSKKQSRTIPLLSLTAFAACKKGEVLVQGMLAIILSRIFCLPVGYPKI